MKGHLLRYLLLTLVAFAGLGASAALATDPHHDPAPHPGNPHPPVDGAACNEYHPCAPPPVTVTVTVPVTETVTVDRPAPPPPPQIVTTPAPPPVTVTTPPTTRTVTRTVTKTRTVVKWRTRTVTRWRTKIVKQCPPPKPKDCEGDCDTVYKGASG